MLDMPVFKESHLKDTLREETQRFESIYLWLSKHIPHALLKKISQEEFAYLVCHLIYFESHSFFSPILLKTRAVIFYIDAPSADKDILKHTIDWSIARYEVHLLGEPTPFLHASARLKIAFLELEENDTREKKDRSFQVGYEEIREEKEDGLNRIPSDFLQALSIEQKKIFTQLYAKSQLSDECYYEIFVEEQQPQKWAVSILLAWKNLFDPYFLFQITHVLYIQNWKIQHLDSFYDNFSPCDKTLGMILRLKHDDVTLINARSFTLALMKDLILMRCFDLNDAIEEKLVQSGCIASNMGYFLRAMLKCLHQFLAHVNLHLYTLEVIEDAFCRHSQCAFLLCALFQYKFHPVLNDKKAFLNTRDKFLKDLENIATGYEAYDQYCKEILKKGLCFIDHLLKTNFFCSEITALSFRLEGTFLNAFYWTSPEKFAVIPYGIFFICGAHFLGFHVRFKDLARGGLRTICPTQEERVRAELPFVFAECYQLALTQHKKNKDIPEGGAKGVIFFQLFHKERTLERRSFVSYDAPKYLYNAQKSFIESLMTLINSNSSGSLKNKEILDYWKRPEYLYLGPDENMSDAMISWIADFSLKVGYRLGDTFISSKSQKGINHKQYGVTSLGVTIYMQHLLQYLGVDPQKEVFTIKMSGGPDGDVAGNQILNLYHFYPQTAKLVALTDATGTIFDREGLDLKLLSELFYAKKGIAFYPPEKLSSGGFLIDKDRKRLAPDTIEEETLCWQKVEDELREKWLSPSTFHQIIQTHLHKVKTDIFIPAGGRPHTLNDSNITQFLDEHGRPTSKGIVEGANLYFSSKAREILEKKGVLIIKDSSANKGGVICSSFEVLCGLTLEDQIFAKEQPVLVREILEKIEYYASQEAKLLFENRKKTGEPLSLLSDKISEAINRYKYQILDHLNSVPDSLANPLIRRCFLDYCLPTLVKNFSKELFQNIPEEHQKAVIACHIASNLIYKKGLDWKPSIRELLPSIIEEVILK